MSFYVFSNGDVADGEGEVNSNFNEVLYAILYNRMEQDAAGGTQIDPSIQSDQFCDADGRYNTVCTGDTTSCFCNNNYINFTRDCFCYTVTTTYCCHCYYVGIITPSANFLCITNNTPFSNVSTPAAYACVVCNGGDICLCDYDRIVVFANLCINFCLHTYCAHTNYTAYMWFNYTFYNTTQCYWAGACPNCCVPYNYICNINNCIIFEKISNNCYKYSLDGNPICCIVGTTNFNYCFCGGAALCTCYSQNSYFCNCGYSSISICRCKLICNPTIHTNIKNYSTPKNTVILSTNSVLPSGNCIRYDIKNQAGCTYLSDAEPDKVYNLCASDSCCFYAVIKQCVECNLCTPQCMYGYALKMM